MVDGLRVMLRGCAHKLLTVRPNSRTRLEILKDLYSRLQRSPVLIHEILSSSYSQLLRDIWKNISADSGQTLMSSNTCSLKLQLHLIALQIIDKLLQYDTSKFIGLDIIKTEDLSHLFDLVDVRNKHVHCCLEELESEWSKEHTAKAYNTFLGSTFGALQKSLSNQVTRYGELYEVILTNEDGSMLISELLATEEILTPLHFRSYSADNARTTPISDYCRISHVISPGYVWVQWKEDWKTLDKIQQALSMMTLKPLSKEYSDENVIVKLSHSELIFRAKILDGYSALGADPAQVLAIDFGWTCTVPKCDMYEGAKVLDLGFEYNIACLCRLTDVRPSENTEVKLLTGSLRVLFYVTASVNWLKAAFSDPLHSKNLLSLIHNSHDLDTIRLILYIFANCAADPYIGKSILDPLTQQVAKFTECPDIMRPVMRFYRTLICKKPDIAKTLVSGPGMNLIMEIYSKHSTDEVITEHFVVIAKQIFSGISLISPEFEDDEQGAALPVVASVPRSARPVYEPGALSTFHEKYSQRDKMQDHGKVVGEKVAFVQRYDTAHYADEIAREISSMLNHKGGKIYVGVIPEAEDVPRENRGEIRGLKLEKKTRDDFRLLIDDILTDFDILKRTKDDVMVPESFLDTEFKEINNTFNANLQRKELQIAIIRVKPLGQTGGLVKFNETQNKGQVDDSDYVWKFFGRSADGRKELHINEIRQKIAKQTS